MASRHDIINITFQANAGKANVALQALQAEAKKSSDRVNELKRHLDEGLRANIPADQIQRIRNDIKVAEKEVKQWNNAYKELIKGVRTLDEAVKQFNAGTLGQMSAAFNKAAANAAKLAQTKMTPGTQEWKEMDALIVEAQSNVLKATTDINGLVNAIKNGGTSTKSTLTQAKSDLEQLLTLEVRGTAEWKKYDAQLKVVTGELNKLAEAERKATQADQITAMNRRMKSLKTESASGLAEIKRFWQTMVAGAEQGSAELTKYEANLKKVVAQERQRTVASAEKMLATPQKFGVEQVRTAVQEMTKLRDGLQQGIPLWNKYNALVKQGETYLAEYAEKEKIARGEALSLSDALKVASNAGGKGFAGTAQQLQMAEQAIQKSMNAAKKGSPEWQKYQQALAKIRVEMQNTSMTSERMREIINKPANAKSLNELSAAVKRAKAELSLMAGTVGTNSKAYIQLADSTKKAEIQLKKLQAQSSGTASSFDKAWSRLKTYIGLYMGAAVAIQKVVATMGNLLDMSDKLGEVRKTTGFTAEEVGRLSDNLRKMDTRTTLNGLLELSVAAGQLGLKTEEDVLGFTEAANKLMVALPEMGKEGATQMLKVALATGEIAKIQKQMDEGLIEGSSATAVAMEKVGSTIDRLRATSAATAPAITDFVKRVGAVGAQSGISIDQIAALGSTVDALGMRVEMSATALSRMLPAIRNNAFDIANILGVTPESIRELYDAGRGMEVILMIFQHIKDANMDADSIENMLGMGGMQEIMKELNQQGARAGIVFGGLSQNVDELRRQLGVAAQAYEENIAIQQEYDKMNETAAAKWERLKNLVEEIFVNDKSQNFLGTVIDMLRTIIELITGPLSGAVKAVAFSWVAFRLGLGAAFWTKIISPIKLLIVNMDLFKAKAFEMAGGWVAAWKKMDAATKANWIGAIATAVFFLGKAIWDAVNKVDELDQAFAKLQEDEEAAERDINRLTESFIKSSAKVDESTKKHAELEEQTSSLRREVDEMKKSTDLSTEAREALRKKSDELKNKEGELKKATDEMNKANKERSGLISEINSKYSTYLGYMLSEITNADLVASAHWRIVAALRAELEKKRALENQKAIEEKYGEDIKEYTQDSRDELKALPRDVQDMIMRRWSNMMGQISYNIIEGKDKGGKPTIKSSSFTVPTIDGIGNRPRTFNTEQEATNYLQDLLATIIQQEAVNRGISLSSNKKKTKYVYNHQTLQWERRTERVKDDVTARDYAKQIWGGGLNDGFGDLASTQLKRMEEQERQRFYDQGAIEGSQSQVTKRTLADIQANANDIAKTIRDNGKLSDRQIGELGRELNAVVQSSLKYEGSVRDTEKFFGVGEEITLENAAKTMLKDLDANTRQRILAAARTNQKAGTGGTTAPTSIRGGAGGASIWGNDVDAESTDYGTWNVNELVERRNQMNKFKNVLKPGIDVRKVLAEDKALMKAINDGKVGADWESVLGWYNTERKKIQKELKSERFSTNEGNWHDEKTKKGRRRRNPLYESDYALAELDRYYSRRKEALEKARAEENITEEVFNRESELLEQEHLQKRSDLRKTFTAGNTKEEQEMVKQFREWWKSLEDRGELDEVPWATVESEWSKATANQIGRNNLKAQEDLTKLQSLVMKHVNQIAKIVNKERPYDGIVINLRKNLTELDVLMADWVKKGPSNNLTELTREQNKRLKFLLGEAEHAYTLTWVQLRDKMQEEGFGDWVAELAPDEKKRELLLQELRNTFDAIQQAIKKEASVIKNQVENIWNDMIPRLGTSMKDAYEIITAELGIQAESTSRANSLIGAGQASERVADKVVIKQMQLQLQMQEHYFNLVRQRGLRQIEILQRQQALYEDQAKQLRENAGLLRAQKKEQEAIVLEQKAERVEADALRAKFDAQHALTSLNLSTTKEQVELDKQRKEIIAKTEESAQRLYKDLMEWSELLAGSVKSLMEASHAGDAEYYNERAKMDLTGKGGPGAGTYIIIENEGTEDATAHYEYLDQQAALERQREIERQNAQAEAWRKVMDDINQKINDIITDQINAMMQDIAIRENTSELEKNTKALEELYAALMQDVANRQHTVNVNSEYSQDEPKNTPKPVVEAGNAVGQMPENKDLGLNGTVFVYGGGNADDDEGLIDLSISGARAARKRAGQDVGNHPFDNTVTVSDEAAESTKSNIEAIHQANADAAIAAAQQVNDATADLPNKMPDLTGLTEEKTSMVVANAETMWGAYSELATNAMQEVSDAMEEMPNKAPDLTNLTDEQIDAQLDLLYQQNQGVIDINNETYQRLMAMKNKNQQNTLQNDKKEEQSTQSKFAKMVSAANLYGIAYQTMSNENLSTAQKFQTFALQAVGQAAISALTMDLVEQQGKTTVQLPGILGKLLGDMPYPAAMAAFAGITALMGTLMALAMSSVSKSKSQISQISGASMGAGRLSTGMLTYAEGNVNEFTDPDTLTPGRHYNVDGADGKTYRAKYTGRNPRTHITSGPEFHLSGEKGREAIIDAHTTRLLQMDETGIWKSIQTLYNGGTPALRRRRGVRGVKAFADGNLSEFEEMDSMASMDDTTLMDLASMQASLDRNSAVQEALLERLKEPIVAQNIWHGPDGIPNMYNKMQKEAKRHGEKYV